MGRGFPAAVEHLILFTLVQCIYLLPYLPTLFRSHGFGVRGCSSVSNSLRSQSMYRHEFKAFFFDSRSMIQIMGVAAEPPPLFLALIMGCGRRYVNLGMSLDRYAPAVSWCDSDSRGSSRSTRQIIAYRRLVEFVDFIKAFRIFN